MLRCLSLLAVAATFFGAAAPALAWGDGHVHHHHDQGPHGRHVEVGQTPGAAVDVGPSPGDDGAEEAGDRARRLDRMRDRQAGLARRAEDHAAAGLDVDRDHLQATVPRDAEPINRLAEARQRPRPLRQPPERHTAHSGAAERGGTKRERSQRRECGRTATRAGIAGCAPTGPGAR